MDIGIVLSILGILLILLEIYADRLARKIEHLIINAPHLLWDLGRLHRKPWYQKFSLPIIIAGHLFLILYLVGMFYVSDSYLLLLKTVCFTGMLPAVLSGILMFWAPIFSGSFRVFGILTKQKPFAGVGLIIAIVGLL